jgi:hypothetical protein
VTEAPSGVTSRFLNVIAVKDGGPPALTAKRLTTTGEIEGAETGGFAVVFSRQPFGAPSALPVSYLVTGTAPRAHVVTGLGGAVDVTTTVPSGNTLVTLSAGSSFTPSAAGVVTFIK